MGVTNSNKVISTDRIACDGSLRVTLALTAAPDILTNPTDIVLALDRSGSMAGEPLANVKLGAKTFIDIIENATGGSGQIGSGSRIGVVSFATNATDDTQLITSVDELKNAVDALSSDGSTNHADAFAKATQLFDPLSGNARVIVMFTDGNTTTGAPPAPVAAAARAQGIIIYCIGLIGSDGLVVSALNEWATDPDASHVAVTPRRRGPGSHFCRAGGQYLQNRGHRYRDQRSFEPRFHHYQSGRSNTRVGLHTGFAYHPLDHSGPGCDRQRKRRAGIFRSAHERGAWRKAGQ